MSLVRESVRLARRVDNVRDFIRLRSSSNLLMSLRIALRQQSVMTLIIAITVESIL